MNTHGETLSWLFDGSFVVRLMAKPFRRTNAIAKRIHEETHSLAQPVRLIALADGEMLIIFGKRKFQSAMSISTSHILPEKGQIVFFGLHDREVFEDFPTEVKGRK